MVGFVQFRCACLPTMRTVVDHVVFFRVKEDAEPAKKKEWLNKLNELRSLHGILHLRAGEAFSKSPWGAFTHVLYIRFSDKAALASYTVHPRHTDVAEYGKALCEDVMAIDWEVKVEEAQLGHELGAKRVALLKLKDGMSESDKLLLLETLSKYSALFPSVQAVSAGPNFSEGRTKGFDFGYLLVFESAKSLEELVKKSDHTTFLETKIDPSVENAVVLDY